MRTLCILVILTAAVASLPGCGTTQQALKPDLPEEYVLPPADDPRFSSSPSFPKETLNTGPLKRFSTPMQGQGGAPARGGAGRMGSAGGFGGGGY